MPDQQNPFQSNNIYGTTGAAAPGPQPEQMPQVGYAPDKAVGLASFANSFLKGAQAGQFRKFQQSEQQKQENERNFDSVFAHITSNPNISKEGKDAAEKLYLTSKYTQVQDATKGAHKDHADNPLLSLTKSITGAVLGPNQNKKHKDLGIDVNSLLSIANDPKYKIDPSQAGAAALESAIGTKVPAPNAPAALQPQGQPFTTGQPSVKPPQLGTPPPPGTLPSAARQFSTQTEAFADPQVRKQWANLQAQGIDPSTTIFGQYLNSLPKTGGFKPVGAPYTVNENGKDVVKRDYFDAGTGQKTTENLGEAKSNKPSSTAEKRAQLVNDYVDLGMTKEQAEKKVAELDTKQIENKAKPKLTSEDLLARNFLDSGKAKDADDAKQKAASMLVDLEKATVKARERTASGGAGGGPSLSPGELQALVQGSILGLVTPQFGRGANDPNRLAYLKTYADTISGQAGGPGALAGEKLDAKALGTTLTQLEKTKGQVGAFEESAGKALDNAVTASRDVPRDSSAMVNGWDQWITKHSVDDPKLQQLFVYTETAANEYARVIGSLTGASTNAAREQANSFIRSQLGEKSFEGAVQAMKTDMKNRVDSLNDKINETRGSIRSLGPSGDGGPKQDAIDPSKNSIELGGKTIKKGDLYKGKPIRGFTKDGHLVVE